MSEAEAEPSPDAKPLPRLGSYRLTEQLGSGGMSNVFRAVHEGSGSVVAVKVLPRTLAKNVTLLQRFIREAKSAESLDHPNIVSIFDRGFDQGRHYLVLEFVEGRDLHDRVRINGPMGIEESIRVVREVAEALRYASGRGMIHRDIKPANLLITPAGHAKVIDLGLALQADDEDERVTRDGTTVGTVDYMAPEQARDSRKTSERSDIYSLGCTFHYLLTGSPPFPGGGLADKLARHHSAAVPDVRARRPDVPERLALLIKKMMAKKADSRFADYTQLIAALDALGRPASETATPMPLDVLIDDEDDDETFGLAPTETEPGRASGRPVEPTAPYLMAEIVDKDDEGERPPSAPRGKPAKPRREPAPVQEISLADLAALDVDDDAVARSKARRPATPPASSPTPPRPAGKPMDAIIEEDEDEPIVGAEPSIRRGDQELPLKTWIAAGALVGLAIALVGFGVSLVLSLTRPAEPENLATSPVTATVADLEANAPIVAPRPREPRPGPSRPPIAANKAGPAGPIVVPPAEVVRSAPAEEKAYTRDWEARLLPPAGTGPDPAADRPRTIVRRAAEAGDDPQTSSLAAAFGKLGDVVEIADTGPFFEDDVQVSGKQRLIRARPGLRPIIKVELTSQPSVREQEAKFTLGGARVDQLTLEGLDLSVDVRDLPPQQTTLFLCRGAEVTLRDCSITLFNAGDRKLSLFRLVDGTKTNRVVLERTTIRGPIRTLVEVAASRAEIVLDRSLIVGESSPVIAVEAAEKSERTLFLSRSLVATSGPLVEWSGKPSPMAIRALGSTFARVEGGPVVGLLHARSPFAGEPKAWLDWSGEDNDFAGWPAWLTSAASTGGSVAEIRTASLGALRLAWPDSDAASRESSNPWPASAIREDVVPADFEALAPDRRGTLARIATPHAKIRELTVDHIKRLPAPDLADGLVNHNSMAARPEREREARAAQPLPIPKIAPPANGAGPLGPLRPQKAVVAPGLMAIDTTFDVEAAPWNGDLGRFLAETVRGPGGRAVVRVRGAGVHASTPVRLPDGVSVAILGETAEGLKGALPTFIPSPNSPGKSMIEIRGGDLALANLAFATDGVVRPRHWVRVEDSILAVRHCRFRDPGGPDPAVAAVIAFVAPGSTPIPPRAGPLKAATDYPTARLRNSLIWTGGDAISAEVGRGVVHLENCLLIAGGPAITLLPGKVAREKFEADLVLERCTIADDRNAIALGPWPGDPAGPSRPWLVATRSCVFPRTQREGPASAMLLVDPAAFARGALSWHSYSDAYEVGRFLASSGPQLTAPPPPADIKKQWIDLWGVHQTRGDRGPDPRRIEHILRYKEKERPRAGKVAPMALELDTKVTAMKNLGVEFRDLPTPAAR